MLYFTIFFVFVIRLFSILLGRIQAIYTVEAARFISRHVIREETGLVYYP